MGTLSELHVRWDAGQLPRGGGSLLRTPPYPDPNPTMHFPSSAPLGDNANREHPQAERSEHPARPRPAVELNIVQGDIGIGNERLYTWQ